MTMRYDLIELLKLKFMANFLNDIDDKGLKDFLFRKWNVKENVDWP